MICGLPRCSGSGGSLPCIAIKVLLPSTVGITHYVERAAAGFLMEKELRYLKDALEHPVRPLVSIMGGAKISDKIEVIEHLLDEVDLLLIGGAMMFTFLKSQGKSIGRSYCENDKLDLARRLLSKAAGAGPGSQSKIVLPVDAVASSSMEDESSAHVVPADHIPEDEMGLDIGPKTVAKYSEILRSAETIVWNGPMGLFEKDAFASGTIGIARAIADSKALSIIGGGDSAAAIFKAGVADRITYISVGGGASLKLLAGQILPGVAALNDRNALSDIESQTTNEAEPSVSRRS